MKQGNYIYEDGGGRGVCWWMLLIVTTLVGILILMLAGCKSTKVVTVERVRTDTCYITKQQRDSIWMHDSIFMKEVIKGDTVYIMHDRWHTKYILEEKHDTMYKARVDSVPVPYPVTEYVRKLYWWQKALTWWGVVCAAAVAAWLWIKLK